jgi:DNA-binding NarL/FixJ family response regulator
MIKIWEGLLSRLDIRRSKGRRYYELDDHLHMALMDLAKQEQRPEAELRADLLADALVRRQAHDELLQCWESLSPREKEVTAFTCLGYTNREIAAKLQVSDGTVKGYVRQALVKFRFNSKYELRIRLASWDFSKWGSEAQD